MSERLTKLREAVSTHTAQVVLETVEKVGKTSAVGGGVVYSVEKTIPTLTITEYAAIVSMVGGIVWIAKMLFDMMISYLKYRNEQSNKKADD